jgi:hypothetical protein
VAEMPQLTQPEFGITILTLTHTKEQSMRAFIAGTVFRLVLATVGFSGIARMLDHGVEKVKSTSVEMSK